MRTLIQGSWVVGFDGRSHRLFRDGSVVYEEDRILREHGRTSLQVLNDIGFLRHDVLLGHCVFHARHSWSRYPYVEDLKLLADSGASIAHAPYKYGKMGIVPGPQVQNGIGIGLRSANWRQ